MLIAFIPVTAGIRSIPQRKESHNKPEHTTVNKTADFTQEEIDIIISNAMEHLKEDDNTESKKALIALCANNMLYNKIKGVHSEASEVSNYSDSFYKELTKITETLSVTLETDNKTMYIPIVSLCNGQLTEDEEYPYIKPIACPWDVLNTEYNKEYDYPCGISVNGIRELCSQGFTYIQVLSHFLPDFSIKEAAAI